jgi:radical SAM superfamily enzyme YgiQ (UPF0313 family)
LAALKHRRFAHYDFWENKVRRSILFDAADLLIYGMAERAILRLRKGCGMVKCWGNP